MSSILVLPGGGYSRHAPHEGEPVAEWLRGLGWDARAVEYPVGRRHPEPLNAVRRELAAERSRGATTVGLIGFSAGGHLAGHAALALPAAERPDFAILGYPVVSFLTPTHKGSRDTLLGPRPWPWTRRSVSLERLVTDDAPPFFLWHTAEDTAVPAQHSYLLASALEQRGVPHELHVFEHGRHGLGFAEGLPAERWRSLAEVWLAGR